MTSAATVKNLDQKPLDRSHDRASPFALQGHQEGPFMANAEKRLDKKLKTAKPNARTARKQAGPKYLRETAAPTPTVGKVRQRGKAS
jgi:hypothetical protein